MENKELIDWLNWLTDTEYMADDDKLPLWAEDSIKEKIKELNDVKEKEGEQ